MKSGRAERAEPGERGRQLRRRRRQLLIALLLVAAALRIWGCFGQGLPHSFNSDERGNVKRALRLGAEWTLDPEWFNKPALGFYVIFFEYGCYYLVGRGAGCFAGTEEFATHYCNDQTPFYLIGRITFSLLGALTVLVTARLGRRLGGRQLGLGSAMVLAVTVGHVAAGQLVKMDVPAALFFTGALVALVQIMRQGRMRDYVLAGAMAGLAMATKYYGAALLPPLVLAHALRSPRARRLSPRWVFSPRLLAGFGSFFGAFFVGSPYNFLNPMWFDNHLMPQIRWILGMFGLWRPGQIFEFQDLGPRVDQQTMTILDTVQHLIGQLVSVQGIGPVLALLALAGLVRAALRRRRGDVFLLVIFPYLIGLLAVSNPQLASPRHLVVLYPIAAVLAALGFEALWAWASRRWRSTPRPGMMLALFAVVLMIPAPGYPLFETVASDIKQAAEDPRLRAIAWIEETIPPGTPILSDGGALPLRYGPSRIGWILNERVLDLQRQGLIDPGRIYSSLTRQWRIELRALDDYEGPAYDLLVMEHDWQTGELRKRIHSASGYNPLWMRSPWGGLALPVIDEFKDKPPRDPLVDCWQAFQRRLSQSERDLAPVEFWTRTTSVSKPWLTVGEGADPRDRDAPRRPVEWLVTTRAFVEEYQEAEQAAAFPDYCRFYEDLVAHYRCYEFPVPDPDDSLARMITVRVYDLRERFEDSPPPFILCK